MNKREERSVTFDRVAEQYDRYRSGYPEQLADDVVRLSGIAPGGRILEIGSGTGKATVLFARRGFEILGLEPGAHLRAVAERNLAEFRGVRFVGATFEAWEPRGLTVDLVIAAQSFHFLDPEVALGKVARVVRPGGALAVFGHHPNGMDVEARRHLDEVYAAHAPAIPKQRRETPLEDRIDATGAFETVLMARYPWSATYSADEYAGLMGTQSDHLLLPEPNRESLLGAIHNVVERLGGSIELQWVTRLHLARTRC